MLIDLARITCRSGKGGAGCVSCDVNNMDPTTYDTPGRYYYARIGLKY